jgi:hypothetical protein
MPVSFPCPGCHAVLRVRDDLVGKSIQCPRCGRAVTVPAASAGVTSRPRPAAEDPAEVEPAGGRDEAPVRRRRSRYRSCPACGAGGARRVLWTFWGSFYFTALFSHVRCPECGYAYNGRTGRSNALPATLITTTFALAILGVLGFLAWWIHHLGWF